MSLALISDQPDHAPEVSRKAFVTGRAKDHTKDAEYLADLLLTHHAKLPVWAPEDSATRSVQQLVGN